MPEKCNFEKIILVTRKTRLEELIERFNTREQAKFYIERSGGDFSEYQKEDESYKYSLEKVRRLIEVGLKIQIMDRSLLPTYIFAGGDIIVTLGQDGLVANTAKYVKGQPIVAINPDIKNFDGVLLPFLPEQLPPVLDRLMQGTGKIRSVSMAEATLTDGQKLLAFNDLFIGARSHTSARYHIAHKKLEENQSSSGIIVSTGAGSTGWLSSIFNEAAGIASFFGGTPVKQTAMKWDENKLIFIVREPFISLHSQASIVAGSIEGSNALTLISQMPTGGVIFSDGVETDHLDFNSGNIARIGLAREKANLVA